MRRRITVIAVVALLATACGGGEATQTSAGDQLSDTGVVMGLVLVRLVTEDTGFRFDRLLVRRTPIRDPETA